MSTSTLNVAKLSISQEFPRETIHVMMYIVVPLFAIVTSKHWWRTNFCRLGGREYKEWGAGGTAYSTHPTMFAFNLLLTLNKALF